MKDPIEEARQRTARYWHIDGLTELAFAFVCLALGVYFYLQATLPQESTLYKILDVSFVLVLFGAGFFANKVLALLKNRITYPRTGFVSYRRQKSGKSRWIFAGAAMLMGALTGGLLAGAPASFDWMPAVTGLILGIAMLVVGFQVGLARFYLVSAASLLLGFGLALAGLGNVIGLGYFYLLMAAVLAASGGLTLWNYLRSTEPGEGQIDGHPAE